jgi:hypothetical protein
LNPGEQRGLDFRIEKDECRLPAGKKSILFFRLGDDTTVIKMERMKLLVALTDKQWLGVLLFGKKNFKA